MKKRQSFAAAHAAAHSSTVATLCVGSPSGPSQRSGDLHSAPFLTISKVCASSERARVASEARRANCECARRVIAVRSPARWRTMSEKRRMVFCSDRVPSLVYAL